MFYKYNQLKYLQPYLKNAPYFILIMLKKLRSFSPNKKITLSLKKMPLKEFDHKIKI